jgi:hypothetical protein
MPWYVITQRCEGCAREECYECTRQTRSLKLLRVFAEEEPPHTLYGPCEEMRDLLNDRMWRLFQFNADTQELLFNFKVDL